ncbi:hypothetical protein HanPI659440_Chr09g0351461 [Helianthus annuus]|nr:hypothetical protein HanPI659440_Chr09g0351461 [Helianthus annuus]
MELVHSINGMSDGTQLITNSLEGTTEFRNRFVSFLKGTKIITQILYAFNRSITKGSLEGSPYVSSRGETDGNRESLLGQRCVKENNSLLFVSSPFSIIWIRNILIPRTNKRRWCGLRAINMGQQLLISNNW